MASERTSLNKVGIEIDFKTYPNGAVFLELRQLGSTLDCELIGSQKESIQRFVERAARKSRS